MIRKFGGPELIDPRPARTSAVDVLTAPARPVLDPHDLIADLLQVDEHGVTDHDREQFRELHRWMRLRAEADERSKVLGRDIRRRTVELLERRIERQWHPRLPETTSDRGDLIRPFVRKTIYPKFRKDLDSGEPHTKADVIPALVEAGLAHLVEASYDSIVFAAHLRDAVQAWRRAAGETGATDPEGTLVDAFDNPLTADEVGDPTADDLAVHPALRRFIEPVLTEEIRFTPG